MSKRFIIIGGAVILIAALVGGTIGRSIRFRNSVPPKGVVSYTEADDIERDYKEAVDAISDGYAGDIDYEKATQAAIQGMLSTLDPHSMYFPYSEFKKLKEDQDSRFYGIGVTIVPHRDGVYIQSAVEGTPAGKLGLRYGDRILEVDGKDAREWSSEQVSKKVRGGRGEEVTIKVERAGSEAPLYFTIIRDSVPLPSIRNAYMLRPGTGYVGLTGGFQSTSDEELREAITKLKKRECASSFWTCAGIPAGSSIRRLM